MGEEIETSMIISPDSKPSIFKLLEEYESSVSPPDPVGWDLPPPFFGGDVSVKKVSGGQSACMVCMRLGWMTRCAIAWYLQT